MENFYLTLLHNATKNNDDTEIQYDMPVTKIKKASDWVVSLDRLQVYTSKIPIIEGEALIDIGGTVTGTGVEWYSQMNDFVNLHGLMGTWRNYSYSKSTWISGQS